jgi:DNA-binding IclR family transcriptional regulator
MIAEPEATCAEWGKAIGRDKSRVSRKLQKLKKLKLVEEGLGKWRVTPRGMKEAGT